MTTNAGRRRFGPESIWPDPSSYWDEPETKNETASKKEPAQQEPEPAPKPRRGRKPKQDAARRGGIIPSGHVDAQIVEADPPVMPARVASNADMAAMWDTHLSWQGHLRAEDAP